MQIGYVDGPRFRRALLAACDHARLQRAELNRINVFPVPDGDTGTNLALTVQAIADHLRGHRHPDVSVVAYEAAQGAVVGARGNCGMMLSHFLLGFAESVASRARITTTEFGLALTAGAQRLTDALERPVEGTILTVMRDAASAATTFKAADFVPLVAHTLGEARRSLEGTPDLLPVLKKAGVVDAGAKGFVSLLEGIHLFVRGESREAADGVEGSPDAVGLVELTAEQERFRFCTEGLVRGEGLPSQDVVRAALRANGDSLIVIRSADVLKVHVHTDDPEEVFSYLRGVGTLVTHKAEDMRAQHAAVERAASGHVRLARRPVTIVTDSASDLPVEVVRAHGIHVTPLSLVDGDDTYRDGVDISAIEFHERMRSAATLPTTSQPAPAAFLESFARAADEGEEVVAVLLGSSLSGTFASAEAAAARFDAAPVRLADSLGASLLEGLLVLKAAELGELGTEPEAIVAEVARLRTQSGIFFVAGDYERLIASGRVSRGLALLGRFLRINPIIGLNEDGTVAAFGKGFGRKQARKRLMAAVRAHVPRDVRRVRFGVVHVGFPEIVADITDELRSEYGDGVEVLAAPAAPVIATHTGIGTWGVAYVVED